MKTYGQTIRTARMNSGLTLAALAKKVGSHKGYISGIENRKVSPPAWKMTMKLADSLGLNVLFMIKLAQPRRRQSVCATGL